MRDLPDEPKIRDVRADMRKMWQTLVVVGAFVGLAASSAQGPELNSVMREKMEHTKEILEAVVTSDWVGLETHSRELERLTEDVRWTVLKYPEYARYSAAFVSAVRDLHTVAAQRDLEKTLPAYTAVTLRCVQCHRYLARERLAGGRSR